MCFVLSNSAKVFILQPHQQSILPFPVNTSSPFAFRCTKYGLGYESRNITKMTKKEKRIPFPFPGSRVAHELHIPVCNGIQRQLTVYSLAYGLSITASNVVVVMVVV